MHTSDNQEIIIYKSRKKSAYLIVLSMVFIIVGILALHYLDKLAAGWSSVILGFLILGFGLFSWFDRRPQVIVTSKGISSRALHYELIEWSAILYSGEFWFRGQYYIRLLVSKDYKPSLLPATWFYRIDRVYSRAGIKAAYIRMSMLELTSQVVLGIIKAKTKM